MQLDEPVNILIVDDKADKLMALESIIADLGNVVKAQSGKDALRCAMKQEFAVILLDVNMPGMDGFETAAMIRQRSNSERTPIIFITSFFNDSDTHMSRGYSLGAVDYILAPVIPEVLRAKVSVFVDLFRKTEQVKKQAEERIQLASEQAARATAEVAERRAAFLAEASRLLVSSMDYTTTLPLVARLAVPQKADICVIDVCNTGESMKRVAVACGDASMRVQIEEAAEKFAGNPNAPFSLPKDTAHAEPELISEVTEAVLESVAQNKDHFNWLRGLNLKSYIIVSLQVRDRVLGRITFAHTDSSRQYSSSDLRVAKDLANRAAIAIDNAILYRETKDTATHLKTLSNELEAASRAKDEFLALMSHELRTPLTPILGWIRMFNHGPNDPASMARGLKVIERNVLAQAKLVEDLLDVSRIITGKLKLNIRVMEMTDVIEAGIDAVRSAAEAKEISIEPNLDHSASTMSGDPDRLQQVVWNLLSNSIKFTPKGGRITVRLLKSGSNVRLEVADSGKGINSKFMPFLFERFRQADSSSTRSYGGLGLGLAIVRHLVELHGGSVVAESEGEGKGSTFTVALPAKAVQNESKIAPRPKVLVSKGSVTLNGLRILLVEDEPDSRELLATIFQQEGATVATAQCVSEALVEFEKSLPDILVSDIAMPDEDGYALIRKVRARSVERGGTIPAIALTAYAKEEDRNRALAEGFQIHVSKPVDPLSLIEIVANMSKQPQSA
jgi:signal transduction histidine kinase/DNA-binding response OmpR family regulator